MLFQKPSYFLALLLVSALFCLNTGVIAGNEKIDVTAPEWQLTSQLQDAIQLAPDWLKDAMIENLSKVNEEKQNMAADLIANPGDVHYRDEFCFLMAHCTPASISGKKFSFDLIRENVEKIYEIEPLLNYVQLVEYGDPDAGGDYYTTTKYKFYESGNPVWREIPRDIYYWYVVHPKISDEGARYTDPTDCSPADPPTGVFWRSYLFYDSDVTASYQQHFLEYYPNSITDAELMNWGPTARGTIINTEVVPTEIARDNATGETVLGDIKYFTSDHGSTILTTTMRVEYAYSQGLSNLLENMIAYGNGQEFQPVAKKHIVFMDTPLPAGTIVEQVLDAQGRNYEVHPVSDIGQIDLTDVYKIIIPSYQSRALYEAVATNRTWFEEWFQLHRRVLEIHLATDDANDPVGLTFPGGFSTSGVGKGDTDDVSFYGYPLLADVVHCADYLWNEQTETLPTGRPFVEGSYAIDVLTNWISKVLKYRNKDSYRPIQPVGIARAHDGNCGELQDLVTSAARTMLIPADCANNLAWDHVWSEFWANGTFHPNGVNWDGGEAFVNDPYFAFDTEYGGGKDLSAVTDWRNDELHRTITDRYSSTCTLTVTVRDANGQPVDGAKVSAIVHRFNNPDYNLVTTAAQFTDTDGTTTFILGDNRDFWGRVESDFGTYPPESQDPEPIITNSQIGTQYTWDVTLSGSTTVPQCTDAPETPDPMDKYRFNITYNVPERVLHPRDATHQPFFSMALPGGGMNFFILDQKNYARYADNEPFAAQVHYMHSNENTVSFIPPYADTWYVIWDMSDIEWARQTLDCQINLESNQSKNWTVIDSCNEHYLIPARNAVAAKMVLEPTSTITDPVDGQTITTNSYTIHGTAVDTLGYGLEKVQISVDDGASWVDASGTDAWSYNWVPTATGTYTILSRAIDGNGLVETPGSGVTVTVDIGCQSTGVSVTMPSQMFHPGDICSCTATVCNATGAELAGYPLFVILDVYGNYYFAPSFSEYDNYLSTYPSFASGETVVQVLPDFEWPEGAGEADQIVFWAALTDPDISALFGDLGSFEFGWRE